VDVDAVSSPEVAAAAAQFGTVDEVQALRPLVHVFTHYKLHIAPWQVTLASRGGATGRHLWWDLHAIGEAPLPAPVKKLLQELGTPGLFG
jgi:A/G-specific adenine glycosylase